MEILLIIKLIIKSHLQFILIKKLFSQSTIYNSFRLRKRLLISIEKIHSIKHIYIFEKKILLKKRFISTILIYELTPLSHTLG